MWFFTFVLKNVLRRPIRSALTGAGVAVAVGAVVSLLGVAHGFEQSFVQLLEGRGVDLMVIRAGVTERLTSSISADVGKRFEQLPHVKEVAGGLMDVVSFPEKDLIGVPVFGWTADSFLFDDLKFLQGRRLEPGDRHTVVLGTVLARSLGKTAGDTVEMELQSFQVVGVFESFNIYENGAAVMLLGELQALMDRPNQVTGFQIVVDNVPDKGELVERLRTDIAELRDDQGRPLKLEAIPTKEYVESTLQIRVAHGMAWFTSALALVIGAIGILNTMIMAVFERTQEIGILRAIGWRKRRIMAMILAESLVLCLAGAAVGTLAAIGVTAWLAGFPAVRGYMEGTISADIIAQGFAIAVLVGLVGGIYPAYRGASLLPTEAIRHE